MRKQIYWWVLILWIVISFPVWAEDRSYGEKIWEDFMETADLRYELDLGELRVSMDRESYGDQSLHDITLAYGYGIRSNMELRCEGNYFFGNWGKLQNLQGDLKAKVYDRDHFTVALEKSWVLNTTLETKPHNELTIFTKKTWKQFVLHHYLRYRRFPEVWGLELSTGVEWSYTEQDSLKVRLSSSLQDDGHLQHKLSGLYRTELGKDTIFLLRGQWEIGTRYWSADGIVEFQWTPTCRLTGAVESYTTQSLNGWVLLEKKMGRWALHGKYEQDLSVVPEMLDCTPSVGVGFYVTDSLELNLQADHSFQMPWKQKEFAVPANPGTTLHISLRYIL